MSAARNLHRGTGRNFNAGSKARKRFAPAYTLTADSRHPCFNCGETLLAGTSVVGAAQNNRHSPDCGFTPVLP